MSQVLSEEKIRELARQTLKSIRVPTSVYRVQLNHEFTFRQATKLIPYFKALGVGALYVSPYFQASPKCLHGYDVTDHNQINPEIGSQEDFNRFCNALRRAGIGQILDVVPNHMSILGKGNELWMDVLENGPSSPTAHFFDIDWDSQKKELKDKVLLPILAGHYGNVLEKREIKLDFSGGLFWIQYWDHTLPITAKSYAFILEYRLDEDLRSKFNATEMEMKRLRGMIQAFQDLPIRVARDKKTMVEVKRRRERLKKQFRSLVGSSHALEAFIKDRVKRLNGTKGAPKSLDLLDELLSHQYYRMAYWQVASDEINYRRFFNINHLAAIRTEDEDVFNHQHQLVFELLRRGKVQGFRIDHPDGLYDPPEYFKRLSQAHLFERLFDIVIEKRGDVRKSERKRKQLAEDIHQVIEEKEFVEQPSFYIVAEKILDRKEPMPSAWAIHGTTGYAFLNALNGLFVDQKKTQEMTDLYERFTGETKTFCDLLYEKKKLFALIEMSSEINSLAHRLDQISERDRRFRDFTLYNLTVAIRETIACFPVYRTYLSPTDTAVSERDGSYIKEAIGEAKRRTPALNPSVYHFLRDILLLKLDREVEVGEKELYRDFILRFQQLSAPIMAKGLEDTAFYIYHRLISLNEVGGDPTHFGYSRSEFHEMNAERLKKWPHGLVTSMTHDTKRSEDVRMRINVLSEMPDVWGELAKKWTSLNEKHKTTREGIPQPTRNTEYLIYQTLLGVWPHNLKANGDFKAFQERIWKYVLKAIREARTFTNWARPDGAYEDAIRKFVYAILAPGDENIFLKSFLPFQAKIANLGLLGSLSATVIKLGSPGVPDLYQGSELEHLCLVDPDNRQRVVFDMREKALAKLRDCTRSGMSLDTLASDLYKNEREKTKLFLNWRVLHLRKEVGELLVHGAYLPLEVTGTRGRNVIAFARKRREKVVIVVAARFFNELISEASELPVGEKVWKDATIALPEDLKLIHKQSLKNYLTDKAVTTNGQSVIVRDALYSMSVAVLTNW